MSGIGAWELQQAAPKMIVGIPHTGHVSVEWAENYKNLVHPPALRTYTKGQPIDVARNILVQKMQESNCDWLFFLDTDVICPADTIQRLLSHRLPIVSGLYYTRAQPINPAMWNDAGDKAHFVSINQFQIGSLVEAHVIGMGCCLIHKSVFDKLSKPYFKWTFGFENNGISEDFYFCNKAREAGFHIYVDTSISCEHEFNGKTSIAGNGFQAI